MSLWEILSGQRLRYNETADLLTNDFYTHRVNALSAIVAAHPWKYGDARAVARRNAVDPASTVHCALSSIQLLALNDVTPKILPMKQAIRLAEFVWFRLQLPNPNTVRVVFEPMRTMLFDSTAVFGLPVVIARLLVEDRDQIADDPTLLLVGGSTHERPEPKIVTPAFRSLNADLEAALRRHLETWPSCDFTKWPSSSTDDADSEADGDE